MPRKKKSMPGATPAHDIPKELRERLVPGCFALCGLTGGFTARLSHRGPRLEKSALGASWADPRRRLVQ